MGRGGGAAHAGQRHRLGPRECTRARPAGWIGRGAATVPARPTTPPHVARRSGAGGSSAGYERANRHTVCGAQTGQAEKAHPRHPAPTPPLPLSPGCRLPTPLAGSVHSLPTLTPPPPPHGAAHGRGSRPTNTRPVHATEGERGWWEGGGGYSGEEPPLKRPRERGRHTPTTAIEVNWFAHPSWRIPQPSWLEYIATATRRGRAANRRLPSPLEVPHPRVTGGGSKLNCWIS